jgi:hypothetical protein
MKATELRRLFLFAAAVLFAPAVLSHLLPVKEHFDAKPIARLRATQPDIVMLSDSMLDNGVDPELMGKLLGGRRVELLWYGSSASASWYFRLKNYIIASEISPELVCILFRDQMLTDPTFKTGDTYRYKLEAAMHEDEPVYQLVLGARAREKQKLAQWVNSIYPLNARRHVHHERIERMVMRGLADAGTTVSNVETNLNETFAVSNLRAGGAEEAAALSGQKEHDFDPDPRRSFLPHIVDLASAARIRLCFLRVQRYPTANGEVPQSERLRQYVSDLREWIESRGSYFIDDTDNLKRTPDMFLRPGDDHMGPWAKQRSTELYADELRPILSR